MASRFTMAPSRIRAARSSRMGFSGKSSGIRVRVAPAALPAPRARCPALRPITTTKYQRWVVRASSIMRETTWVACSRAVSNPKVGMPWGSGKSLSMVLGTWATAIRPSASSATRRAEKAVSSPPMVIR